MPKSGVTTPLLNFIHWPPVTSLAVHDTVDMNPGMNFDRQLARRLRKGARQPFLLERAIRNPGIKNVALLAKALRVTSVMLMEGVDE
jgi:hypothetical protein